MAGRSRAARIARSAAACVAAALLAAGCGSDKVEEALLSTRIDAIEVDIKTRIGPALCSSDSECRALPIGALACGGPSRYLPYSIRNTDEAQLAKLADDHQRLSREQLAQQQAVGVCIALLPPQAYCELSAPVACKLR